MLYGKRFGLLQQDVEEESLNFIKAVKTVWKGLSWGWGEVFSPLQLRRGRSLKEAAGKSSSGFCAGHPKGTQLILEFCSFVECLSLAGNTLRGQQGDPGRRIISLAPV